MSKHPGIRLGKTKPWKQIWHRTSRAMRKPCCKYISDKKEDKRKCGPSPEGNRRPGYLRYGEGWGIHQHFASIFISKCPHHTVHVREGKGKGLGKLRTDHYRRRTDLRPSKELEVTQVQETRWDESTVPERTGRWSCWATIWDRKSVV